ncbi:glutathione peroxidase [Marinobacter nanhaiticus D15-8W]|uniref:Glutathione peroxidase n=1 Tax=Marinobacter nanhaiticus D15-8W TaxID=626887 RepID=N6W4D9_9GAMM|nr:glutathione peroxidase [Marinobacter nanhaiticus]ENO15014.1 glutathione peroxidase [Marinobacter nanhaiticus D15-8W]
MRKFWLIALPVAGLVSFGAPTQASCPDWLDEDINKLRSTEQVNFCDLHDGKPMLVVNTASFCGYTGQFEALETVYQAYRERGFTVVGVPSNDFRQEADSQAKTAEICFVDYGVTFTMTAPQSVKGVDAHPVFRTLAEKSGAEPGWNFNKYLIDADARQVWHYPSNVVPDDPELTAQIEALLQIE